MTGTTNLGWLATIGAAALSIALVTAFSVGDTGTRDVTASVVTDADAFIALEKNTDNSYSEFVSTDADGALQIAFDGTNADAAGSGINPGSTYEFHALVNVTNQATESIDATLSIQGTDSDLCQVAWTSTASQASADYTSSPSALTLAQGEQAYLGIQIDAGEKTNGDSIACTIQVTA